MNKTSTITAEEFEAAFDCGDDISAYIDMDSIQRPGLEPQHLDMDFPKWLVESLDDESRRLGVARDALIKLWISERLHHERKERAA